MGDEPRKKNGARDITWSNNRRPERWFIIEKAYTCVKQQDMSDLGHAVPSVCLGICDGMAIASCSSCNHSAALWESHGCCTLSDRTGICPGLPGEEVGCTHGVRPAFGRPMEPSWGPMASRGWETTGEVRSGGRELGSCCCCSVGRSGGFMAGSTGRSCEAAGEREGHTPAGRSEDTWTETEEERGRGNREAKHKAPQSSSS